MKKLVFLLAGISMAGAALAQVSNADWSSATESAIKLTGEREIIPQKYQVFSLKGDHLKNQLMAAPHEKNVNLKQSNTIIYLPLPNGRMEAFRVVESPVMDEALSAAFPQIKSFNVKGVDDVYACGKLDWNEFGFHGMVRTPAGDFFIDPYCRNNQADYISYYTRDFVKDPSKMLPEVGVIGEDESLNLQMKTATPLNVAAACVGANLRIYRLAIACTGEYAVAATGSATPTTAQILSKVQTTVNRVDGAYEVEGAIKLVLVASTTLTLYGDASSDPFSGNNNANTLIGESQNVIGTNIGSANYDIGHTFSTGGGGLANLGCVCSSTNKARGITGSPAPVGDPYDIDYVAHEMGHQFGGNHTFNSQTGSCSGNRNASTSMEPGSGITIMAYAGICGSTNDLAAHSIAYFHAISYDEIVNYSNTGNGNSCPNNTATANHAPVVTIPPGTINVPPSTPFSLTGTATDQDGDPVVYSWEEVDAGPGSGGNWNAGTKPFFQSYAPTTSGTRLFPKLSSLLVGPSTYTTTRGEFLPTTAQTLKFRLTVRDNVMGGGGVCSATATVVVNAGSPFAVTSQSTTGISYPSGSSQTVTWAIGSSTTAPVSCANVNILVSTNAGATWSVVASNVPNNGSAVVTMPTVTTTTSTCRVKVECANGAFFDINDKSFTITNSTVTGISEVSAANSLGVQLFPNPFSDEVQINIYGLSDAYSTKVTIYDMLGHVVVQDEMKTNAMLSKTYNLGELAKGVYIVQMYNGNKKAIARLVKQ